jgi:L-malate glycosyltransferase
MQKKRTILHIIDYMGRGGAEVMLVKVLKELAEYNNIVVTLNPQNHFGDEFTCDEYHCLNMGSFARFPLAAIKLRRFIRQRDIGLVHSHLYSATLVARLATPKRIPLITTIHTNVSTREYKKWYMKMLEWIGYNMHRSTIIGVSAGVMNQYFSFFGHRPYRQHLLYTFVDLKELEKPYEARPAGVNKGYFTLVAIGALRFPKNQQYLVRAFEKLKDENFELHIYGIGVQQPEMERLVKDTGAKVVLKGEVKQASRLLPQYDLYVMPSEYEGFSLSVLEAMAMNIPMLLSDIPSFREQCADTAVFFNLNSTDDFINKLKMLAADKEQRNKLVVTARQRVLDHFTLEHHMQGLRKIYTDTLITTDL